MCKIYERNYNEVPFLTKKSKHQKNTIMCNFSNFINVKL